MDFTHIFPWIIGFTIAFWNITILSPELRMAGTDGMDSLGFFEVALPKTLDGLFVKPRQGSG